MPRRLLALLLLASASPALAQQPYLDMAPMRYSLGVLGSQDATTALVTVDRSIPLFFFLPNVGRNSHVDVAVVAAGVRRADGRNAFRYRITALELTLSRPPGVGGFTLLSYDRSGSRDVVADWIGLHAGPDARIRLGSVTLEPRLVLNASLASRRVGHAYFPDGHARASEGATGAAGSLEAALTVVFGDHVRFEGSAGVERFSAGPRPEHRHASGAIHATIATRFELVARAGIERSVVRGTASDATLAGVTLRFTPAAQAY